MCGYGGTSRDLQMLPLPLQRLPRPFVESPGEHFRLELGINIPTTAIAWFLLWAESPSETTMQRQVVPDGILNVVLVSKMCLL